MWGGKEFHFLVQTYEKYKNEMKAFAMKLKVSDLQMNTWILWYCKSWTHLSGFLVHNWTTNQQPNSCIPISVMWIMWDIPYENITVKNSQYHATIKCYTISIKHDNYGTFDLLDVKIHSWLPLCLQARKTSCLHRIWYMVLVFSSR